MSGLSAKRKFIPKVVRLFTALLIFILPHCTGKIDLYAPGSPVPVVYCLLDPDANDQYVRIGRTFNCPSQQECSGMPVDSMVWNVNPEVYLEERMNEEVVRRVSFLPTAEIEKDTGFFPVGNLRLFHAEFRPSRSATYCLYVYFPDDKRMAFATARIPEAPVVHDPLGLPDRRITFLPEINYTVRWTPPAHAGINQCQFEMIYREEYQGDIRFGKVVFGNDPTPVSQSGTVVSWILAGNRFFIELERQIPVKAGVTRKIVNVGFRFFTGGEELALQVTPEILPGAISPLNPYTNVINGIGIFSSLQVTRVDNLSLSTPTLNEIAGNERTRNLGFSRITESDGP